MFFCEYISSYGAQVEFLTKKSWKSLDTVPLSLSVCPHFCIELQHVCLFDCATFCLSKLKHVKTFACQAFYLSKLLPVKLIACPAFCPPNAFLLSACLTICLFDLCSVLPVCLSVCLTCLTWKSVWNGMYCTGILMHNTASPEKGTRVTPLPDRWDIHSNSKTYTYIFRYGLRKFFWYKKLL